MLKESPLDVGVPELSPVGSIRKPPKLYMRSSTNKDLVGFRRAPIFETARDAISFGIPEFRIHFLSLRQRLACLKQTDDPTIGSRKNELRGWPSPENVAKRKVLCPSGLKRGSSGSNESGRRCK